MNKHYLKAGSQNGYRVRTRDNQVGVVRDLVVDAHAWGIPYLSIEADSLAPGREVLVSPRAPYPADGQDDCAVRTLSADRI